MKRLAARRRGPNRPNQRSTLASSSRAQAVFKKKYVRPRRAPRLYAVRAPRTLPDSAARKTAANDNAPVPARKKPNSIVESPGTGGKTYSSQARRKTRSSAAQAWAAMALWIASLMTGSDLLDQVAQEGDRPALAAHRLDDAHDGDRQIEQHQVDQAEGEQPGEHAGDGGEHGPHEDHAQEVQTGDAAQDESLLGVPAHVLAAREHEWHDGQDPEVREDQHDLVLLVQVLGRYLGLVCGQRIDGHRAGTPATRDIEDAVL